MPSCASSRTGASRWYVNGQGQTFAVIDGPVEFRMGSPPSETERLGHDEPLRRMVIPRRFAIADQGGDGRAVPAVLEARRHHDRAVPACAGRLNRVQPRSRWTVDRSRLVHGGPLLQLAERAGGLAEGPVVLHPREGGALRRGDDASRPTCSGAPAIACPPRPNGSTPAGRAVTSRYYGLSTRPARTLTPGTRPTAGSMPGRAGTYCPTTSACSTCWAMCMNGVRTGGDSRHKRDH